MVNFKCLLMLFSLIVLLHITNEGYGQRKRKRSEMNAGFNDFLDKQWWIGARGGFTRTKVVSLEQYSVFSSTSGTGNSYNKNYSNFRTSGFAGGIEVTFNYKFISFSFQPNYRRYNFSYSNQYSWIDTSGNEVLKLNYEHLNQLDYFEFPFLVRVDILKKTVIPFVQAGYYFSVLDKAGKQLKVSGSDLASGGSTINYSPIIVGADDLFIKSSTGFIFGAGVTYDIGNIRFLLDVNYRLGTNVITNRKNRYTNNFLAGSGDVMDDLKLRTISINLGALFPLRFLTDSKYYKSK